MAACIFCRIVAGEIPSSKLYEDDDVLSFLDINPINFGHSLVIPKKHFESLFDAPAEEVAKVAKRLPALARAVAAATAASGVNIFQASGAVAGQVVLHLHFHIVPRHPNEGFTFGWRQQKYAPGAMQQMQERILKALKE
jgi:histidine triad (HIT) family protein